MTHIRDKTIHEIFGDVWTLKISEFWKLLGATVTLVGAIFYLGFFVGGSVQREELATCTGRLERDKPLLQECRNIGVTDLQDRIDAETTMRETQK